MRYVFLALAVVFLLSAAVAPSFAVGKYTLAYWRECGYNEKGGTGGTHVVDVHVWDENGNPVANKTIYTDGGTYMGTTDANGCAEVAIYEPNSYNLKVVDGSNLSDVTPGFSTYRAPDWGHYSFSCGFMYKSDSNNTGTFNLSYYGTFNSTAGQPCDLSAPYTYSLGFYSTKPEAGYYCSDSRGVGNSAASVGQTFVASGNRVVACQVHAYLGWPSKYVAKIRAGGPTGSYVGSSATSPDTSESNWLKTQTKWAKDGVQVTQGQTYYLEITKYGGGNISSYRVTNNNYSGGCYYEGTTALTGYELEGSVVCCTVGAASVGTIAGNVKTNGGANLSGATVQTNTGGYSATTDASGNYTISNVATGTYDVTASKTGYVANTQTGKTVSANATTTVNFTLTQNVGTITGNVKNSSAQNISGATVSTNTGGYSTTTDASGNYTLSNVTSGSYTVTASKTGYNSASNNVTVSAGQTVTSNFTLTPNTGIASQDFESMPTWNSSFDASWGSAATWSIVSGGQAGNFLQASRTSQGSSSKVLVYTVPTNTNITVSAYMKCPSYANSYWIECACKLGNYSASDFDANSGTWTYIKKFSNTGTNGNGDVWTQYSTTLNTGSSTQISVGYKHGASGCVGPTAGWDTFRIN